MRYNKPIYREENGGDGGDGGGGNGGDAFTAPELKDTLSPEFRANPALVDFANPDALAKSYIEMKAFQGNSIHIPGEDASDDAKKAFTDKLVTMDGVMLKPDFANTEQSMEFFQSIGMPKESVEYKYTPPEDVAADSLDDMRISQFQGIAHKHHLTKQQFQGVIGDIVASDMVAAGESQTAMDTDKATLVAEWGQAHQQNMDIAINVAKLTGAPESFVEAVEKGGTSSAVNKWLYGLSKKFDGEGMNFNEVPAGDAKMTPAEAREKISEINNNDKHPYWVATDPGHGDAIKRMIDLQGIAHPAA